MALSLQLQKIQERLDELERSNKHLRSENDSLLIKLDTLKMQIDRLKGVKEPKPVEKSNPQVFYKIGQKFRYVGENGVLSHDTYLFAQIGFEGCNLIGLKSGNRWTNPIKVKNCAEVPKEEFDKHFNGENAKEWRRVE